MRSVDNHMLTADGETERRMGQVAEQIQRPFEDVQHALH